MNTSFKVIGLTRLGIKPESTAAEAGTLTTRPSELFNLDHSVTLRFGNGNEPAVDAVVKCVAIGTVGLGSIPGPVKLETVSPTARQPCNASSELRCPLSRRCATEMGLAIRCTLRRKGAITLTETLRPLRHCAGLSHYDKILCRCDVIIRQICTMSQRSQRLA